MNDSSAAGILFYLHLTALGIWMGGLFVYLSIIWPAIMSDAAGRFPRALLAVIAMRTAPWIYFAMSVAFVTFAGIYLTGSAGVHYAALAAYGVALAALIGNNVYGTVVAWPRMMLLPFQIAGQEWFWFRVRMRAALAVGVTLYVLAIYYDFNQR